MRFVVLPKLRQDGRCTESPFNFFSQPYLGSDELLKDRDQRRRANRKMRRELLLPASPDVEIIGDMILALIAIIPQEYCDGDSRIETAVISYPGIVALYEDDIIDAMEFRGLRVIPGQHYHLPREIVAAYAGHGMGLCQSYTDKEKCTDEGLTMPIRWTLHIEYTTRALVLHFVILRSAVDYAEAEIDAAASFEFGSDYARARDHVGRIQRLVHKVLWDRLRVRGLPPDPILVIMTGDRRSLRDRIVQRATIAAVKELKCRCTIVATLPETVAARGAAELAWRALAPKISG
jgi:hypothetical protein